MFYISGSITHMRPFTPSMRRARPDKNIPITLLSYPRLYVKLTIYIKGDKMKDILNIVFWNNTVRDYIIFAAVLVLSLLLILIIKVIIVGRMKKKAKKTGAAFDKALAKMTSRYILPLALLAALFFSAKLLTLPDSVSRAVFVITLALILILASMALSRVLIFIFNRYWQKKNGSTADMSVKWIGVLIKIAVWLVFLLLFLDNLDIKITALLAGLGVGGIAIAFALNAILQDLFAFVTIFFDRPFEIGDYINVDNLSGNIEHIGIKTTRVRSLSGEQLIFSNKDLTNSRIHNYKRMENRRIAFSVGVTYDTPSDKLRLIPEMTREIIGSVENSTFDRAHLKSFDDFCITFEIVYYVLSQDYAMYMDIQQEINLNIKAAFDANGIEFAFPTQTIYLEKDN